MHVLVESPARIGPCGKSWGQATGAVKEHITTIKAVPKESQQNRMGACSDNLRITGLMSSTMAAGRDRVSPVVETRN